MGIHVLLKNSCCITLGDIGKIFLAFLFVTGRQVQGVRGQKSKFVWRIFWMIALCFLNVKRMEENNFFAILEFFCFFCFFLCTFKFFVFSRTFFLLSNIVCKLIWCNTFTNKFFLHQVINKLQMKLKKKIVFLPFLFFYTVANVLLNLWKPMI